jgi:hypothetical protein
MIDLGFDIASRTKHAGASNDAALHVAVWRGRHETVRLLVARGAPLETTNDRGETPLAYAVRAAVQSEWIDERSTESIAALLEAGARADAVTLFPSGFAEADAFVSRHRTQ